MFNMAFADIVGFIRPGALQEVGRTVGRANHSDGLLLVFALLHTDPDRDDLRVSHTEAGAKPLGEHGCNCDHLRVRSRRRVDGAPLLRVLRSCRSRVHGVDRLVRLDAAQLRSRCTGTGRPVGRAGVNRIPGTAFVPLFPTIVMAGGAAQQRYWIWAGLTVMAGVTAMIVRLGRARSRFRGPDAVDD